jgi:apolipoprotein N-acyltransferase
MHDAAAIVRALEGSAYLLRADKGGMSSIIDPRGRVLSATENGVIVADLNIPK